MWCRGFLVDLELTRLLRMTFHFWSSCLHVGLACSMFEPQSKGDIKFVMAVHCVKCTPPTGMSWCLPRDDPELDLWVCQLRASPQPQEMASPDLWIPLFIKVWMSPMGQTAVWDPLALTKHILALGMFWEKPIVIHVRYCGMPVRKSRRDEGVCVCPGKLHWETLKRRG